MAKRKDKRINWDDVRWTPFEPIDPPFADGGTAARGRFLAGREPRWMANSIYIVLIQVLRSAPPFGAVVHLAISTRDQQPRHDWREMQRIKNELVGDKVEAVEIFPSEDRLVDNANWYHLYCFPKITTENGWLPFGYEARFVSEGSVARFSETGEGFRQRDFRPELRPDDVIRADQCVELGPDDRLSGRCPQDGSAFVFRSVTETVQAGNGKAAKMLRGECLKGHHVVFVASRQDLEQVERGTRNGSAPAAEPEGRQTDG